MSSCLFEQMKIVCWKWIHRIKVGILLFGAFCMIPMELNFLFFYRKFTEAIEQKWSAKEWIERSGQVQQGSSGQRGSRTSTFYPNDGRKRSATSTSTLIVMDSDWELFFLWNDNLRFSDFKKENNKLFFAFHWNFISKTIDNYR